MLAQDSSPDFPAYSLCGADENLPFLSSLQLSDSFFPGGLYTLSHGLEAFAQAQAVTPDDLEILLADYLRFGFGSSDAVALACAHRALDGPDIALAMQADSRLTAVKLAREARETSVRTGRQLLRVSRAVFNAAVLNDYAARTEDMTTPGNHAVVLGLTMAALGIELQKAVASALYAFISGSVAAAVRLSLVDHVAAQVVLHRLKPVISEVATLNARRGVQDIASSTPRIDIMLMRHERSEVRLFMS